MYGVWLSFTGFSIAAAKTELSMALTFAAVRRSRGMTPEVRTGLVSGQSVTPSPLTFSP